ncbi:thiazole biosynthesis enzyme [Fervidobacterium nodosum Rt17-B1]|uniref:Thiamine thiazole synthase n=2 Tax=Fervidobacterium nodosum TaxID=2424 RepID=THI4_FERNB|nr:RecName: Full=Thiamine thiazole synthase [Fervidobacterium nodosum Rt17-B1]ABS61266.1 thiazole biosynthesis enzyme [Fervidobacterium nodosum Rt17-B1]
MSMKDLKISQLIVKHYFQKLNDVLNVDVAIAGCGPSALALATELAKNGRKVAIFEAKNEPGGGIWGGGMMFNELVLESELEWYLKEHHIKYKKEDEFIVVDAVHFASAMLYNATKNGAYIFNNVFVEDLVMYNERISGVVINWMPTIKEKLHVDPITVVAKFTVDGTGHPANLVRLLSKRGIINSVKGSSENLCSCGVVEYEFPMDAENGEKFVVENTKEIYPGLYVMGMAAVSVGGGPRMGPIFGGMIMSGLRAAELIEEELKRIETSEDKMWVRV